MGFNQMLDRRGPLCLPVELMENFDLNMETWGAWKRDDLGWEKFTFASLKKRSNEN